MIKTVGKIALHIREVQKAIFTVADEMRKRALVHDKSKFQPDELEGYARFENFPEGLVYGSDEYKAEMHKVMQDNNCFALHTQRNDHHPEFWAGYHYLAADDPEPGPDEGMSNMGLFPLIEMVCDWAGAMIAYKNKGGWQESVEHNIERFGFTEEQRFVIREVAEYLSLHMTDLNEGNIKDKEQ